MTMGEQYAPIHFITAIEEVSINPLAEKLTPRKLQVLKWLIEDKSNKKMFSISPIPRSNNTSKRTPKRISCLLLLVIYSIEDLVKHFLGDAKLPLALD